MRLRKLAPVPHSSLRINARRGHFVIPMSRNAVRKPAAATGDPARAKLYRSELHAHQWIAFLPGAGWWIFPDEVNGWSDRRLAVSFDRGLLQPAGARPAAHTGFYEALAQARALEVSA